MNKSISLGELSKQVGVPKTSLRRWLNTQGYDTSNGVSADGCKAAQQHYGQSVEFVRPMGVHDQQSALAPMGAAPLVTFDPSAAIAADTQDLLLELRQFTTQETALEQALRKRSQAEGRRLGHQMMAEKYRAAMATAEELGEEIAAAMGVSAASEGKK